MKGSTRGMCSAILGLETVILALAAPVLINVEHVSVALGLTAGLGLAAACVVVIGALGRPWAAWAGHAIQVAAVALGFVTPIMFALGAMFAALWFGSYALGRKIERDKARWAAAETSSAAG